jgi:pimeloyl-ACP methyl ester carboxylesterase
MGNSMGGAIGIGLTARRPELVDQLVLVDPAVPHLRPGVGDWMRLARLAPMLVPSVGRRFVATRARVIGPERLVNATLAWCVDDPSRIDPELRRRLIALAVERYAYAEAPAAYAQAARSLFVYLARGVLDDLGTAAANRPTLLVHGERDQLVPVAAARHAAQRHPAVELRVLDGIGHTPQMEDPARFVREVTTWLDTVAAVRVDASADRRPGGARP